MKKASREVRDSGVAHFVTRMRNELRAAKPPGRFRSSIFARALIVVHHRSMIRHAPTHIYAGATLPVYTHWAIYLHSVIPVILSPQQYHRIGCNFSKNETQ